jgi:hypothetical protein
MPIDCLTCSYAPLNPFEISSEQQTPNDVHIRPFRPYEPELVSNIDPSRVTNNTHIYSDVENFIYKLIRNLNRDQHQDLIKCLKELTTVRSIRIRESASVLSIPKEAANNARKNILNIIMQLKPNEIQALRQHFNEADFPDGFSDIFDLANLYNIINEDLVIDKNFNEILLNLPSFKSFDKPLEVISYISNTIRYIPDNDKRNNVRGEFAVFLAQNGYLKEALFETKKIGTFDLRTGILNSIFQQSDRVTILTALQELNCFDVEKISCGVRKNSFSENFRDIFDLANLLRDETNAKSISNIEKRVQKLTDIAINFGRLGYIYRSIEIIDQLPNQRLIDAARARLIILLAQNKLFVQALKEAAKINNDDLKNSALQHVFNKNNGSKKVSSSLVVNQLSKLSSQELKEIEDDLKNINLPRRLKVNLELSKISHRIEKTSRITDKRIKDKEFSQIAIELVLSGNFVWALYIIAKIENNSLKNNTIGKVFKNISIDSAISYLSKLSEERLKRLSQKYIHIKLPKGFENIFTLASKTKTRNSQDVDQEFKAGSLLK